MAKPSYKQAHKMRKHGVGSMEIDLAPKTFEDKNLDPKDTPGDPAVKMSTDNAAPGGSISPEPKALKQTSTKADPSGLTRT